jgi:hypothetical protein
MAAMIPSDRPADHRGGERPRRLPPGVIEP